jgi:hypothetical protein
MLLEGTWRQLVLFPFRNLPRAPKPTDRNNRMVVQSTAVTDFTTATVTTNDIIAADLVTTSGTGHIDAHLICNR